MTDIEARPGLTPAVQRSLEALASGQARSLAKAAKVGGISRQALSESLRKPAVVAELDRLATLQRSVDRAGARNVLRSLSERAKSEYVRLEASKHLDQEEQGRAMVGGVVINIDLGSGTSPMVDVTPPVPLSR